LEDSYKDNHRILEERSETLKRMQKESREEWGAFVANCVGLAESFNRITLIQKQCEQLEFRKKNPFLEHPELTPLPAPITKVSGYGNFKTPLPPKVPQQTSVAIVPAETQIDTRGEGEIGNFEVPLPLPPKVPQQTLAGTVARVVSSTSFGDQDKEEDETTNDQNGIFKIPLPPKVPQQAAIEATSMDIAVPDVEIRDDENVNFEVPLPLPPKVPQQEVSMDIAVTEVETRDDENGNFEVPLPLPPKTPQQDSVGTIANVPSSIGFGDKGGETNESHNFKTPLPPKVPQQTSVGLFSMDIGGVAENETSNDDSGIGFFNLFGSMNSSQTDENTSSFSFNLFDTSDSDISPPSSSNSMFF
jgi:hypothetical protein